MADAKLKLGDGEIVLAHGVTTLGRTTDNTVAFPNDANVSRYHAEIEWRDGDFYLIELGSSNGTTLNGAAVSGDKKLSDGDEILLGGSSKATFSIGEKNKQAETAAAGNTSSETKADAEKEQKAEVVQDEKTASKSRMPLMLGIAGATVGL